MSEEKKSYLKYILIGVLVLSAAGGYFFLQKSSNDDNKSNSNDSSHDLKKDHHNSHDSKKKDHDIKKDDHGSKKDSHSSKTKHDDRSSHKKTGHGKHESSHDKKVEIEDEKNTFGQIYELEAFNVNLRNLVENNYISLSIALQYKMGDSQKKEIKRLEPKIRHTIISILSDKTKQFLLSKYGKTQLKLEILNSINEYMENKIEDIFYTNMLIR